MEMTKEEILAMEAGRLLDVLVAQEIFSIEVEWDYPPCDFNKLLPKQPFMKNEPRICLGPTAHSVVNTIFDYSTDILAAWPIAVKMGLALFPLNNKEWVCFKANYVYLISVVQDHYADPNLVICREAPEAICKAALIQNIRKEKE